MSGRWIALGDTRVNVEAQSTRADAQAVVDATMRLFAVHTLPSPERETGEPDSSFRCTPASIAMEHAAEMAAIAGC